LNYELIIPDLDHHLEQDEEWVTIKHRNKQNKIRLHDYAAIYKIPGLYEEIFCKRLRYNSPKILCDLFEKAGCNIGDCRALDLGAGNGMVGEEIKKRGGDLVIGIDILNEAKEAAERDRAGVYDDYFITDLSQFDNKDVERLKQYDFNTLVSVAALGFEDIPPRSFLNAFNLIKDDGWIAFNIKDRFLTAEDTTGYKDIIKGISEDNFTVYRRERYCHRLSLSGENLNYIAIIGKKIKNVNLAELLNI